uniref:Uncharacterized protein n=1 Tax=Oryza punctata TaxID=4537 RepID=A0A0E0MME3_ORYPU
MLDFDLAIREDPPEEPLLAEENNISNEEYDNLRWTYDGKANQTTLRSKEGVRPLLQLFPQEQVPIATFVTQMDIGKEIIHVSKRG